MSAHALVYHPPSTQRYEIVRASILHVRPLAEGIRSAARLTIADLGRHPRIALRRALASSHACFTALIDHEPVAMWGLNGPLLSSSAYVWLALTERVTSMPVAIVREARAQLAEMMRHYDELAVTILADDDAALRFAVYLGFHDRHDGVRRTRKETERLIRTDPKNRISFAGGDVIALGYHPEDH